MNIVQEPLAKQNGKNLPIACLTRYIYGDAIEKECTDLHFHSYIEFLYGISGNALVFVGNRTYKLQRDDLIIIQSNEAHNVICTENSALYYVIKILPSLLQAQGEAPLEFRYSIPFLREENPVPPFFPSKLLQNTPIHDLMYNIMSEWLHKACGYEMMIQADVMKIIVSMMRLFNTEEDKQNEIRNPALKAILQSLLQEMQSHFRDWDENAAADFCHLSYSYFSRNFKKAFGMTFSSYRESLRMREAEKLLLTSTRDITDIALYLGFATTGHFIDRFKNRYGITPLKFRALKNRHFETK